MKKGAYSFGQLMDQLRKLPEKLSGEDGFYRLMIDSVIRRQEDDESKDGEEREQDLQITRQIFTWDSLSKTQLFLEELEAALAMQAGSDLASDDCKIHDLKRGILFFGGGLVEVRTTKTGVASVQLIHQTAREIPLESSQPAKPYHLDQISGDKEIAATCCRYLRCIFTADILLLPPNEEHGYMDQLTAHLEKHTLLEYCIRFLRDHVKHLGAEGQNILQDLDAFIRSLSCRCRPETFASLLLNPWYKSGFCDSPCIVVNKTASRRCLQSALASAAGSGRAVAVNVLTQLQTNKIVCDTVGQHALQTAAKNGHWLLAHRMVRCKWMQEACY